MYAHPTPALAAEPTSVNREENHSQQGAYSTPAPYGRSESQSYVYGSSIRRFATWNKDVHEKSTAQSTAVPVRLNMPMYKRPANNLKPAVYSAPAAGPVRQTAAPMTGVPLTGVPISAAPMPGIPIAGVPLAAPSQAVPPPPTQGWVPQPALAHSTSKARRPSRPRLNSVDWAGPPAPCPDNPALAASKNVQGAYVGGMSGYVQAAPAVAVPGPYPQYSQPVQQAGYHAPARRESLYYQPQRAGTMSQMGMNGVPQQRYQYQLGEDDGGQKPEGVQAIAASLLSKVDYYGNKIVDVLGMAGSAATTLWDTRHKYEEPRRLSSVATAQPAPASNITGAVGRTALYQTYDPTALV